MGVFRGKGALRRVCRGLALAAIWSLAAAAPAQAGLDWLGVNTGQAMRGIPELRVNPSIFYDRLTGMGGNALREDVNWNQVERENGVWDWGYLDNEIDNAPPGVGVILTLLNSPRWARDPIENLAACGLRGPGVCRMPPAKDKLHEWMDFVRTTVGRYRSKVVAVEVWNESNSNSFWRPNGSEPARWADLVEAAAQAAADVDPTIPIVTGGLRAARTDSGNASIGMEQGRYLDAAYASNPDLAAAVDGIGIHLYPGQLAPDDPSVGNSYPLTLGEIRAVRDAHDPGTPLWVTETGYYTRGEKAVTEAQQRDWLLQIHNDLAAAPDVKAMIIHTLFEPTWICTFLTCDQAEVSFGLVNPIGNLPKPAWTGFHDRFAP